MSQNHRFIPGHNRAAITYLSGTTVYTLHKTVVVEHRTNGEIVLNSGGYRTATTKLAMNQASNQFNMGFQVFQNAGDWFVTYKGKTIPFYDEMILN